MKKITFNLHFIDHCNFGCKHCFVKKEGKELTFEQIKIIGEKLADYQKKHNVKIRVNLAGGEPLLSKNIQLIIDYLFELGLEISIITNGYYLTEDFIKKNQEKLSMIGISVDSLSHETNIRIGRYFKDKTLSKEELINTCNIIKKYNIQLKINTCVTSINANEDINELISAVNPDRFKLLRAFCDDSSEYNISDEQWENAKSKYPSVSIAEDNDYMAKNYLIIDSECNLSKNNLHIINNSLLDNSLKDCLENLNVLEGQKC